MDNEKEINSDPILHNEYFATFPFKFDLIQPYPKKVLDVTGETLGDIPELRSGANLLVEYQEVGDSDASDDASDDDHR